MIITNIFLSILLFLFVIIYHFLYPRKKINLLILLVIISILPIVSIFRFGDYESGDFNIHIYRSIAFLDSLKEGNLIPSWAKDLNATYGYPLFIFLNPLPYYLQSLIHFLGFSFISSLKLLLALSYIFSGVFFYFWAKKEIGKSFPAFFGAIIYLFSPYHLVDLHFRASIGEVMFFALLPFFFYSISLFNKKGGIVWFLTSAVAFSLMIFSHQAMALFSFIIIIPYFIFSAHKNNFVKKLIVYLCIIFLGFIFSLYTWLPHILYPKHTLAYLLANQIVSFPKFQELIYSMWIYGFLFQGPKGELSYAIGYSHIIIVILGLFIFIRKKTNKILSSPMALWTGISFFLIFMNTPFSSFIWSALPILNTAQFSTRLLLLLSFSIAVTSSYLSIIFKKYYLILWLFLIVTIAYTMLNWGHRRIIPQITDSTLLSNLPASTNQGEGFCCMAQPKWTNGEWEDSIPKNHLEILNGRGTIKEIVRTSTKHQYIIFSKENLVVKENTWYFPGWSLLIDGKSNQIDYTNKKYPGIILFSISPGLHKIELLYNDSPEIFIAKLISVVTFFTSLSLIFFILIKKIFFYHFNYIFQLLFFHIREKRKRQY